MIERKKEKKIKAREEVEKQAQLASHQEEDLGGIGGTEKLSINDIF
jgi:hypothetical protein